MSGSRARSFSDKLPNVQTDQKLQPELAQDDYPNSAMEKYIDEEPITPHTLKRTGGFENLNGKLANRPGKDELLNRNILKDDKISPVLHAAQQELKKRKIENSLNHKIGKRTSITELVDQNIILDPNVASSLHTAQKNLKRSMCEAELSRHLRERKPVEELVQKQILRDAPNTSAI